MKYSLNGTVAVGALGVCSALSAADAHQPNFLWITSEDNNVDWVGCYGNSNGVYFLSQINLHTWP